MRTCVRHRSKLCLVKIAGRACSDGVARINPDDEVLT
jgi:hypothetical protein